MSSSRSLKSLSALAALAVCALGGLLLLAIPWDAKPWTLGISRDAPPWDFVVPLAGLLAVLALARVMRAFLSVADLQVRVLAFVAYYNRTMAKPFKWTYQGKALVA